MWRPYLHTMYVAAPLRQPRPYRNPDLEQSTATVPVPVVLQQRQHHQWHFV